MESKKRKLKIGAGWYGNNGITSMILDVKTIHEISSLLRSRKINSGTFKVKAYNNQKRPKKTSPHFSLLCETIVHVTDPYNVTFLDLLENVTTEKPQFVPSNTNIPNFAPQDGYEADLNFED